MIYKALLTDEFLSHFRLDDNGKTLVLTDKTGLTRAVCIGELVRCKDCKFNYGIANNCEFSKSDIVCTLWESDGLDENDYCSRGVRRKQDE